MICDSHCHLKHGNKERTEYAPEAIVEIMDAAGIDKTVVFAMCVDTAQATRFALNAHKKFAATDSPLRSAPTWPSPDKPCR